MDMIGRIRRLHSRGKKSEREISRMTGLSRNTIAKWLKAPLDGEPKYRRSEQPGKLTAFHEVLKQALKVDAHRPKHERRTALVLGPMGIDLECLLENLVEGRQFARLLASPVLGLAIQWRLEPLGYRVARQPRHPRDLPL